MILKQFYLGCLAHASYIVIDEETKTAVVIDPQRDIEQYLEEAEKHGAEIKAVLLTHFHADFIAGHLELRDRVGARIHLGARAEAEYDFTSLADGADLDFGDFRLHIRETPGHTPEGISIVLFDRTESDEEPKAVFTGDTLFVGDVGRPDLMASIGITAEELAGMLYDSLHDKLLALPDATVVYPAHGAGSMCGKNLGKETFSTIGEQRSFNYALQPMSKQEFIGVVTAQQPEAPAYFGYDAMMNKKERETLDHSLERSLHALGFEQVLQMREQGAQLIDVRDEATFAAGHMAGSIGLGLDGKFATWAGTLLSNERPIVIIGNVGQEMEAAVRLGRVGLDNVAGFLDGGANTLQGHPESIVSYPMIDVQELAAQLDSDDPPLVVDIRSEGEWHGGHIEGSLHIPLAHLRDRAAEIPEGADLRLLCRTGYRSPIAASLLEGMGVPNLMDVAGGILDWKSRDLPVTPESEPSCQA
ncbi:MAG: MBL fold metallo-hydrolase [Planctomycetota bacterium]|jgi:glyoxylase-like metal-dependent hydrolase (beta-lactamase superfamily II)/rhodanese-related sulfurtransferase